ncbi:MAG TPA: hypothetical protein VL221_11640, partial [Bacteroidota bacterium]|nr:hypothetical protein [Bacteroidota bacterium]
MPYRSAGYKYQVVKPNASVIKTFATATFNDAAWTTGTAAFGAVNPPGAPACPMNDTAHIKVVWPASQDMLVRRHFTVPAGALNVKVALALENQVQVFLNGTDISGGVRDGDSCAAPGTFVFSVPASLVKTGDNVIALHGIYEVNSDDPYYRSGYLDVQITGDLPLTITASAGPNGTIAPAGAVTVPVGGMQRFAVTPAAHYHVDTIQVDGARTDSLAGYTFTNVVANHTIRAVFAINRDTILSSAGPNGSVSPAGAVPVPYGGTQGFAAIPVLHFHV